MPIDHVAVWTWDLERVRSFYATYFGAVSGPLYESRRRPFRSYFLDLGSGTRLELMQSPEVANPDGRGRLGWAHIAISVGSQALVDELTARLAADGFVTTEPRVTGDGFYESTVEDPEGNLIEITV